MLIVRCWMYLEVQRKRECTGARHSSTASLRLYQVSQWLRIQQELQRYRFHNPFRSRKPRSTGMDGRSVAKLSSESRHRRSSMLLLPQNANFRSGPSSGNELQGNQKSRVCLEKKQKRNRKCDKYQKRGRLPTALRHAGRADSRSKCNILLRGEGCTCRGIINIWISRNGRSSRRD